MEIADEVGLSRSQVHRILAVIGDAFRGDVDDDDDSDDPWTDDDGIAVLSGDDAEDDYPPPPWTFCGYEGDEERWLSADGRPVSSLDRYRWIQYQKYDFDDFEGARRVKADADRQREAYAARFGQR